MSWDVSFMKMPDGIRSIDDIPDDYKPPLRNSRAFADDRRRREDRAQTVMTSISVRAAVASCRRSSGSLV